MKRELEGQLAALSKAFRRVHAAAPLKPAEASDDRALGVAFRRVHAAAPLKREPFRKGQLDDLTIPPCSRGGPIEAIGGWISDSGRISRLDSGMAR